METSKQVREVMKMNLDELRRCIEYDPHDGVLRWIVPTSNRVKKGSRAGANHCKGYRQVRFGGVNVLEHRLVWFHFHGVWPEGQIDHINGDRLDNRIANLRDIPAADNQKNMKRNVRNKSGFTGVYLNKDTGMWVARGSKKEYLGQFECKATAAYLARRSRLLSGYHKNHGRVE